MSWLGPVLRQAHAVRGIIVLSLSSLAACGAGAESGASAAAADARAQPVRPLAQHVGDPRVRAALRTLPRAARSRSMQGLSRVETADGPIKLNLEGRFQHASVAVVDTEGALRSTCVDGASETSATE